MDEIFERQERREIGEIPIAAILDMLVAIIFFLLLSTTFVSLSSVAVPPSRISTITDPQVPPPLSPKLLVIRDQGKLAMTLVWDGLKPGRWGSSAVTDGTKFDPSVVKASSRLIQAFQERYPEESKVQIGFSGNASYQDVISVVDGVRLVVQDIILISSEDTVAALNNR